MAKKYYDFFWPWTLTKRENFTTELGKESIRFCAPCAICEEFHGWYTNRSTAQFALICGECYDSLSGSEKLLWQRHKWSFLRDRYDAYIAKHSK